MDWFSRISHSVVPSWYSLSFKMTSAAWMLPLTGAFIEGLSQPVSPLVLWMYKCSPCIPRGTTLMLDVCLTLTSLSWPDPAVLLKGTVNRTFCLCVSCPFVCVPPSVQMFSAPAFWITAQPKDFHHRQQCCACPKQFGSHQMKQKRGFPRDSLWATVQSVKRVERQRWREGEGWPGGELNKHRVE